MKDLILIIVSILWCIPILISFVISGLREKLESDRNFCGEKRLRKSTGCNVEFA